MNVDVLLIGLVYNSVFFFQHCSEHLCQQKRGPDDLLIWRFHEIPWMPTQHTSGTPEIPEIARKIPEAGFISMNVPPAQKNITTKEVDESLISWFFFLRDCS